MTREMKNSGVEWIGDIPGEWEIVKVKSIFNIGRGRVIAKTELEDSGYPIYSSQTKNNGILGYIGTYDYDVDQLTWTTDGANAGTVFLRTGKYNCTNVCGTLALKNNLNCLLYMKYALEYIAIFHKRPDTNGYKIMNNEMADIKVTAPPLPEQKKIADFLDSKVTEIDKIISETKASIENYKEYKQSVITEAVTKGLDKNVPMKDSGIEWIGGIPCEWKATKLKNVSENVTDGAHISPETDNGVYDFISTVNLDNGQIDFDNCLKTSVNSYKYLVNTGCKPQINDVLISKDGTVGKTIVIDFQHDFVVASSLVIIRPTTEIICPYYLNYNLQSKFVQDTLLMLMHGAGLKRVSVEKNENLPVVVPPMEEQTKIVEYLNYRCTEIDTLILQKEKLITNLEEYKKSLIYEYVTGKKAVE